MATVVLASTAIAGCDSHAGAGSSKAPSAASPAPSGGTGGIASYHSTRVLQEVTEPVRVRIPSINVSSGLERLTRQPDGTVGVPVDYQSAGWYSQGPRPGEPGSAVILGHVDSKTGPAVFFRATDLRPGAVILVDRAGGEPSRFVVTSLARYPKDRFPTDEVYFPTLRPELRLVTCGGSFDSATGHYRDNVVVYASRA